MQQKNKKFVSSSIHHRETTVQNCTMVRWMAAISLPVKCWRCVCTVCLFKVSTNTLTLEIDLFNSINIQIVKKIKSVQTCFMRFVLWTALVKFSSAWIFYFSTLCIKSPRINIQHRTGFVFNLVSIAGSQKKTVSP